jgi:excisionase family DNA binding protein
MPQRKNPAVLAAPSTDVDLYAIPEVARRLNTTVPAVRELIRSGRLRYLQIGHKMLISPTAIEDFIRTNEAYYSAHRSADKDKGVGA